MRTRHWHLMAGIGLLCLLPVTSAFGSGYFAWTMYSGSGEYRIDARVVDRQGRTHTVAPTGLADDASPFTADVLVGADHFRRGPSLEIFRAHLDDFARFVCRERGGAAADVALRQRKDAASPERVTRAHADCR